MHAAPLHAARQFCGTCHATQHSMPRFECASHEASRASKKTHLSEASLTIWPTVWRRSRVTSGLHVTAAEACLPNNVCCCVKHHVEGMCGVHRSCAFSVTLHLAAPSQHDARHFTPQAGAAFHCRCARHHMPQPCPASPCCPPVMSHVSIDVCCCLYTASSLPTHQPPA